MLVIPSVNCVISRRLLPMVQILMCAAKCWIMAVFWHFRILFHLWTHVSLLYIYFGINESVCNLLYQLPFLWAYFGSPPRNLEGTQWDLLTLPPNFLPSYFWSPTPTGLYCCHMSVHWLFKYPPIKSLQSKKYHDSNTHYSENTVSLKTTLFC